MKGRWCWGGGFLSKRASSSGVTGEVVFHLCQRARCQDGSGKALFCAFTKSFRKIGEQSLKRSLDELKRKLSNLSNLAEQALLRCPLFRVQICSSILLLQGLGSGPLSSVVQLGQGAQWSIPRSSSDHGPRSRRSPWYRFGFSVGVTRGDNIRFFSVTFAGQFF